MAESNELPAKKIVIQFKDWGSREITVGTTILEALGELSPKLKKEALAARLNGKIVDLNTPLQEDASVDILTFDDPEGAEVYRHTASHVLAQAVKRLYGNVRLGIGPPISNGFYYDFDFATPISPEDLEKIEEQVKQIIKEDLPLQRLEVSREEALKTFQELGEPFKVELISDLPEGDTISCYRQGEFIDLWAGPHLPSTGNLGSFKLLNLAGAYWRGNERNPMLQRIYGTAFPRKEMLEEYLHLLEEARNRDHRNLGRELPGWRFWQRGAGNGASVTGNGNPRHGG